MSGRRELGELRDLLLMPDGSVDALVVEQDEDFRESFGRQARRSSPGVSPRPEAEEALPSRATVERPAATLQPARPRLVASLLSVRNWQQLGKFCVVGAVGYLINLAVYDALLHAGAPLSRRRDVLVPRRRDEQLHVEPALDIPRHRGHVGIQGMRFFVVSLAALGANLLVLHCWSPTGGSTSSPRRPSRSSS